MSVEPFGHLGDLNREAFETRTVLRSHKLARSLSNLAECRFETDVESGGLVQKSARLVLDVVLNPCRKNWVDFSTLFREKKSLKN